MTSICVRGYRTFGIISWWETCRQLGDENLIELLITSSTTIMSAYSKCLSKYAINSTYKYSSQMDSWDYGTSSPQVANGRGTLQTEGICE